MRQIIWSTLALVTAFAVTYTVASDLPDAAADPVAAGDSTVCPATAGQATVTPTAEDEPAVAEPANEPATKNEAETAVQPEDAETNDKAVEPAADAAGTDDEAVKDGNDKAVEPAADAAGTDDEAVKDDNEETDEVSIEAEVPAESEETPETNDDNGADQPTEALYFNDLAL
ncbi:hypothetical protein [Victivallis sp. Marseille-Q1083]|uniref:hypothetical protein n=1 Tax=Victivallis sp. Marseille-Q1083 TaxID=2717288 RepID=UPI001589B55B|nr:hypothetical protein [Victivallis sp. Marseille-Q1083]